MTGADPQISQIPQIIGKAQSIEPPPPRVLSALLSVSFLSIGEEFLMLLGLGFLYLPVVQGVAL